MRTWLNDTFYEKAFSEKEKKHILSGNVFADNNPFYKTDAGKETVDKLFYLSVYDAKRYFISGDYYNESEQKKLMCKATPYAIAQGVQAMEDGYSPWTLRTPAMKKNGVTMVARNSGVIIGIGDTEITGIYVDGEGMGVRPALFLDLNYAESELQT